MKASDNKPLTHRQASTLGFLFSAFILIVLGLLIQPSEVKAQTQIAHTVHNLTPSGPGPVRVGEATGLCVFCHTPHNANPTRALWNRELPGVTYNLYESSTLEAQISQPTGSSRLCLSCHDGVLALGNLRVPPKGSHITLGPLTGKASLGTDLSDDHPISFIYDSALALRKGGLVDPHNLPSFIRLDSTQQLQCSTCHDPHDDRHPDFLRMDNRFGSLCLACHRPRYWGDSAHAQSSAVWKGIGQNPWPEEAFPTVAENACLNCHRPHAAGHPERLLAQSVETANCTICHNGAVASKNIEAEFLKPFHHPVESNQWTHDPKEQPASMPRHVTCVDCHNPHAVTSTSSTAPAASGRLRGVSGITMGGNFTKEATFEYEICLKCHGMTEPTTPGAVRQDATRNIRLKIDPNNPSYHPIAAPGKNTTIAGLLPPYTASSVIYCTDCHNNDDWTPSEIVPRGPHGSRWEPILEQEFESGDPSSESPSSYALCYKCHDRASLLFRPGGFPHEKHVVEERASCSVCHDVHGSRLSPHLINFKRQTKLGNIVVSPTRTGRLEYVPDPARPGHGSCYLTCHGEEHNPHSY